MQYIGNVIFLICLIAGFGLFYKSLREIYRNIRLGKPVNRSDRKPERWRTMINVSCSEFQLHLFMSFVC